MSAGSSDRVPPWQQVKDMLSTRTPQAVVIDGTPSVELVVDGAAGRLCLRCEAPPEVLPTDFENLAQLEVSRSTVDDHWLEVATRAAELFPFFLAFAATVADAVQLDHAAVREAVARSLRLFRRLMRDNAMLPSERWLGLLGELWVLNRLITAKGADALESWLGPNAEAHDFRLGSAELEVKSTRKKQRHHIINGLDQLVASPNYALYIVSLQFAASGPLDPGQITLAGSIGSLRERLREYGQADTFTSVLIDRFDLFPEAEHRYNERLKHRSKPQLITVTERSARLVRADLKLLPRDEMQRVLEATYVLNCDGLGDPEGSSAFEEVLP